MRDLTAQYALDESTILRQSLSMPEKREKPRWLFWVEAIAAILGTIIAANEVLAIVTDEDSVIGRYTRSFAFFSEPATCDPDKLTIEEFELCLRQGGVER